MLTRMSLIDTKTTCWEITFGALAQRTFKGSRFRRRHGVWFLAYEQAIRKRAYVIMIKDRLQLGAALEQAWKCPTVKERHFITPLALYSKRSYGASSSSSPSPGVWNAKGKGKSKSPKGSSKGKGQGPSGEKYCYRFNKGMCKHKGCKFAHICSKCYKKGHNALNCKESSPDTTGTN